MNLQPHEIQPLLNTLSLEEILRAKFEDIFRKTGLTYFQDLHHIVMSEAEKALFCMVLEKTKGNQAQAARILGVNRNTLHKKLVEYQLLSSN